MGNILEKVQFEPKDPAFAERIRASFEQQKVMAAIGAQLSRVDPGLVDIELPYRPDLTQQDGFLHAGIITTIADSACGYAAYSLMPASSNVLSVEFKVNLMRPAQGEKFIASARVLKPGRTLTIVAADVIAVSGERSEIVATMLGTMICRMTSQIE